MDCIFKTFLTAIKIINKRRLCKCTYYIDIRQIFLNLIYFELIMYKGLNYKLPFADFLKVVVKKNRKVYVGKIKITWFIIAFKVHYIFPPPYSRDFIKL